MLEGPSDGCRWVLEFGRTETGVHAGGDGFWDDGEVGTSSFQR